MRPEIVSVSGSHFEYYSAGVKLGQSQALLDAASNCEAAKLHQPNAAPLFDAMAKQFRDMAGKCRAEGYEALTRASGAHKAEQEIARGIVAKLPRAGLLGRLRSAFDALARRPR